MSEQNTAPLGAAENARMWDLQAQHEALPEGQHLPYDEQTELHALISRSGGSLLHESRIPLTEAEHAAVDKLVAANPGVSVALTRRDPGETGPVLVTVGDDTYTVSENGRAKKGAV